MDLHYFIKKN